MKTSPPRGLLQQPDMGVERHARSSARDDRVSLVGRAGGAQPFVNLDHERREVGAALGLDLDGVVGEVHQHRLAAPDPAPQIDATGCRGLGEQPRQEPAIGRALRRGEAVERGDGAFWSGSGFNSPAVTSAA